MVVSQDLVGVAFIDTQIYIHRLVTLKSLLLVGDVNKSITVLRFEQQHRTISMVSKDLKPLQASHATDGFMFGALFMCD